MLMLNTRNQLLKVQEPSDPIGCSAIEGL